MHRGWSIEISRRRTMVHPRILFLDSICMEDAGYRKRMSRKLPESHAQPHGTPQPGPSTGAPTILTAILNYGYYDVLSLRYFVPFEVRGKLNPRELRVFFACGHRGPFNAQGLREKMTSQTVSGRTKTQSSTHGILLVPQNGREKYWLTWKKISN